MFYYYYYYYYFSLVQFILATIDLEILPAICEMWFPWKVFIQNNTNNNNNNNNNSLFTFPFLYNKKSNFLSVDHGMTINFNIYIKFFSSLLWFGISCSWRHDALVLREPIAKLLRNGQKWHLRARFSKLDFPHSFIHS